MNRRFKKIFGIIIVSLLSLLAIYSATVWLNHVHAPRNVILILVDTLRADHLGCYGYSRNTTPYLDVFCRNNIKFSNAYSTASWTTPAIASIFTSYPPPVHQVNYHKLKKLGFKPLSSNFLTLAEELNSQGYHTLAVSSNPIVSKASNLDQGFEVFTVLNKKKAELVNEKVYQLIPSMKSDKRPFFLYIHYFDPHSPYSPPIDYASFSGGNNLAKRIKTNRRLLNKVQSGRKVASEEFIQESIDLYDDEIFYTDSSIKELMDRLEQENLLDDTMVVFVSDHGEQFGERGNFTHGYSVYDFDVKVPLIIKLGDVSLEYDGYVSTSDLYPTILDVMGVESSHYNGSKSLFERIKTHECDALYIESLYNNYKGVINCLGHKFMHQYSDYGQTISFESVHNPQVFDLKSDSNEEANIYGAADQTQLINQYNDIILNSDVLSEKFRVNDSNYSSEMQDRLRDLGYIA